MLLAGLLLILAPIPSPGSSRAPEPLPPTEVSETEIFERGVNAYRRGEFEEARVLWERLLERELSDLDRARLCFDLGNVEWRSDRRGEAIGWYTAALRLDPRHSDAWANLEFARSEEGFDPADRGDLRSTGRLLVTRWYPGERRAFLLLATALFAVSFLVEIVRGTRLWRAITIGALLLLLLFSVPWIEGLLRSDGDAMLIIRSSTASLRSEPRLELPATATAAPASVVERIDELPGWVRVETGGGEKGWMQEEALFALRR
jgi:tetratricopeptide (TPR) repeat protein